MQQLRTAHYRPDIDALRGIAVIAVVAFHAFPDALPGGFVGVDVFFVISGYLITNIIAQEIDSGSFSFRCSTDAAFVEFFRRWCWCSLPVSRPGGC